jgi:hypothetical protein
MKCTRSLSVLLALAAVFAHAGAAASQTGSLVSRTGTTVSGMVRDSIAHRPLAGATVQLVAADKPASFSRTAISDSLGRYTLTDVPFGRHMLGFFHPMLDSLGLESPVREISVGAETIDHADLGIPSAARLRGTICGARSARDSSTFIVGVVRDATDGTPLSGVTVTSGWLEISLGNRGFIRRTPHVSATTASNGWFAICDVPNAGSITLLASRGGDSTDLLEVDIPKGRFLRYELYLDSKRAVTSGSALVPEERTKRPAHTGTGHLSGTVVTAIGGRAVGEAQVEIVNGPATRANDKGEWTLDNVPAGTRMLEVRAVGFMPTRRHVHVVRGAAPVSVEMWTLSAVLDTVKVRSSRIWGHDLAGFYERRRNGAGRFLTDEDIARKPAVFASDVFRSITGIRLGHAADTVATDMMQRMVADSTREFAKRILIHGITGNWCAPAIYLEGIFMPGLTADDIDAWVRPINISGIEIYSEATAPSEYKQPRSGCGTIIIWTR